MQMSLQQFLAVLSDHCRTTQASKATSTLTREIGVQCSLPGPGGADKAVQTDHVEHQDIPEADVPDTAPTAMEGDVAEEASEASCKRSREESPADQSVPKATISNPTRADDTTPQPPPSSTTKRARVALSRDLPLTLSAKLPQGEEDSIADRGISTPISANDPGAEGDVARSTLQIQIGPPNKPDTPAVGACRQTPTTTPSEQGRNRQRIGWPESRPSQMQPPPLPKRPPPISARLGPVSPMSFPAAQTASERSNTSDGTFRSRSMQRSDRRSESSTSRERPLGRRSSYSCDNIHET